MIKKYLKIVSLAVAGLAILNANATSRSGSYSIGRVTTYYNYGKFGTAIFEMYDYIGGTYQFPIYVSSQSSTAGIPDRQDLNGFYNQMINAFQRNGKLTQYANYSRSDDYFTPGNNVQLGIAPW